MPDARKRVAVRCGVCDEALDLSHVEVVSAAEIVTFVQAHAHDGSEGTTIELVIPTT